MEVIKIKCYNRCHKTKLLSKQNICKRNKDQQYVLVYLDENINENFEARK